MTLGLEISTCLGHIIVLGVDVPIELKGTLLYKNSIIRFLEKLRNKLSAVIMLAHLYSCKDMFTCMGAKDEVTLSLVSAIEAINGRSIPKKNVNALILARKLGKAGIASTDAHEPRELGIKHTIFPDDSNNHECVLDFIEKGIVKLGPIPKATKVLENILLNI